MARGVGLAKAKQECAVTSEPTALEQLYLEMLNRARTDPAGEFDRWVVDAATREGVDEHITAALRYFNNASLQTGTGDGVDMVLLENQLTALTPAGVLAWNPLLADSADLKSEAMIDADRQSHDLDGDGQYDFPTYLYANGYFVTGIPAYVSENLFAYGETPEFGHASIVFDYGFGTGGIQTPPLHREAMMDPQFNEVGIAALEVADTNTTIGPVAVTQHLGRRDGYQAQLLGVVINDADGDDFYDIGEGLGGITITAVGDAGTFVTTTWASGGYQMVLPEGVYTVTFSGDGLDGVVIEDGVVMGSVNIKLDAQSDDAAPPPPEPGRAVSGGYTADVLVGGGGDDTINGGAGFDTIDGGEGNDNIVSGDGYDSASGGTGEDAITGNNGFDTLEGGTGDDTLSGGLGTDMMDGGTDDDLLSGQAGSDTLSGGDGDDTLNGNAGADSLSGENGNDVLSGGINNDTLVGGEGQDTLNGGNGSDMLDGGDGDDRLEGNSGADVLNGGAGDDTLRGGIGADTFVFTTGGGHDQIVDLSLVDTLRLEAALFTEANPTAGDLNSYASSDANGFVVLTFGTDTLTFTGVTNLNAVANALDIF